LLFDTIYKCCNLLPSAWNKGMMARSNNNRNRRATDFAIMPLVFFIEGKTNKIRKFFTENSLSAGIYF
jgi:hypothetical protein